VPTKGRLDTCVSYYRDGDYQKTADSIKALLPLIADKREEAEAYKPEFRTKCTTDRFENDLTTLVNDDSFKIDIVELEL